MFHPRDKRIIKSHVTYKVGLDFYHITNAINVVPLQSHTQSLINIPSLILISTAEGTLLVGGGGGGGCSHTFPITRAVRNFDEYLAENDCQNM